MFKLAKEPKTKPQCFATFVTTSSKKKASSGKAKAKAKAKSVSSCSVVTDGPVEHVDMPGGLKRIAWLIDDMLNSIMFAVEHVVAGDWDQTAIDDAIVKCLEFAFSSNGKVKVMTGRLGKEKEKIFSSWAAFRKHIRRTLAEAHPGGNEPSDGEVGEDQDGCDQDNPVEDCRLSAAAVDALVVESLCTHAESMGPKCS